ncbi:MAG: TlpA family protein disulfide reductase [Alphaproteobacteria bacterium]|nr:TlpA family protein disulfide reductase [Alphaproteobacteria bacterium]
MMFKRLFATIVFLCFFPGAAPAVEGLPLLREVFVPTQPSQPLPRLKIRDEEGRERTLQDVMAHEFKGQAILLNVWAPWCAACIAEMPGLDALEAYSPANRLSVLALAQSNDGDHAIPAFYQWHNLKYLDVFWDSDRSSTPTLRIEALPTTLFINRAGQEIGRVEGPVDWTQPDNLTYLSQLLSL